MRAALSSLKAPGDGALTAAPAKRVADARPAVVHRRVVDAASRQVGQGWRWGLVTPKR